MNIFVGLSMSVLALAAAVPATAQVSDPESAQMLCDLTGDCEAAVSDAGAASASDSGQRKARTGSTRGFTFSRQTSEANAQQAARPAAPAASNQQLASRGDLRPVTRPTMVGASDLKVTFISGSAVLNEPSKVRLAKFASILTMNQLAGRRLRIEGHTDASGSSAQNRELSRRRAQAVADYLASRGVDRGRVDVVGYGDTRLLPGIAANAPANRRVVAVLL